MSSAQYTVPLNAYPLAGTDGRAIPSGIVRPGWVVRAVESSALELPDEVNYVTFHVDTPIIVKEVGNAADHSATIEPLTVTPQKRTTYLPAGSHTLVVCRFILVSGACIINGHTLWQQMAPTTKWRTGYVN